jgi:hypothetical protein
VRRNASGGGLLRARLLTGTSRSRARVFVRHRLIFSHRQILRSPPSNHALAVWILLAFSQKHSFTHCVHLQRVPRLLPLVHRDLQDPLVFPQVQDVRDHELDAFRIRIFRVQLFQASNETAEVFPSAAAGLHCGTDVL